MSVIHRPGTFDAGDDDKKHTIEEEMPVTNSTPLCTGEEADHYNQEDKSRPNNSEEATPESDGGDQSRKTSNESLNIKESITEEQVSFNYTDNSNWCPPQSFFYSNYDWWFRCIVQAIQEYENLKTPDRGDGLEKEMKIEEDITTEHSLESTREDTAKCFEETDTEVKCKVEVNKIENSGA